jgi:twitching motility protein PilT
MSYVMVATAHAPTSVDALTRLIGMVPEQAQNHFRAQLGAVLEGIIAQQLIPHRDQRHVVLAAEVLLNTQPIRNLIVEKNLNQINSFLDTEPGSQSLTMALRALVRTNKITKETALAYAPSVERLRAELTQ